MPKKKKEKTYEINNEPGIVTPCGGYVRMKNGSTFKRTVLKSSAVRAQPETEADKMLENLDELE